MWTIIAIIILIPIVLTFCFAFIGKKKRTKLFKEYLEEKQKEVRNREEKISESKIVIQISVPEPNDGLGLSQYLCGVINYPSLEMVKDKFKGTHLGTMSSDLDDWCFRISNEALLKEKGVEIVDFSGLELFIKEYSSCMGYSSLKNKKKTGKTFAEMKKETNK